MAVNHVEGVCKAKILVYALSTCVWCKKAKQLLGELGVAYDFLDVDSLAGEEKQNVMSDLRKFNPQCSFPTILINDKCIAGFKESEIKAALV